jgi:hypothetical protein
MTDNNIESLDSYYRALASIDDDDRPSSIINCLEEDGSINAERYAAMLSRQDDIEAAESAWFDYLLVAEEDDTEPPKKRRKSKRSVKTLRPYYFDNDGNVVYLLPTQTFWYLMYVKSPPLCDKKFHHKFRRRFRMPYETYRSLLDRLEVCDIFGRWYGKDATGTDPSPIELLLLSALRYLGRGLTFDDLEEYTAISEETHRQFFHKFIHYGRTILYPEFVYYLANKEEYKSCEHEYGMGGLPGCGFSSDATFVIMWNCSHNLKQAHMGFKNTNPARTYNICINHRRWILNSTPEHASRWNDKTLAYFDTFLFGIRDNRILQDVTFDLYSWKDDRPGSGQRDHNYNLQGCMGLS